MRGIFLIRLQFISGEFTLRAFLNGRLDLSQAENVAQLISAKSVTAAESALAGIQVFLVIPAYVIFLKCTQVCLRLYLM